MRGAWRQTAEAGMRARLLVSAARRPLDVPAEPHRYVARFRPGIDAAALGSWSLDLPLMRYGLRLTKKPTSSTGPSANRSLYSPPAGYQPRPWLPYAQLMRLPSLSHLFSCPLPFVR